MDREQRRSKVIGIDIVGRFEYGCMARDAIRVYELSSKSPGVAASLARATQAYAEVTDG